MSVAVFDTLKVVETLEQSGFSTPQAKTLSVVMHEVQEHSEVATKQDIAEIKAEIR